MGDFRWACMVMYYRVVEIMVVKILNKEKKCIGELNYW